MATPEAVNAQITDAITQTNSRPLEGSSGAARGSLYMATAHAMGIAAENAVNAQQQQNILQMSATTQGIMQIYSLDTAANAGATGGDKFVSTLQGLTAKLPSDAATQSIDQAVDSVSKVALHGGAAWPVELREVMFAVAESLRELQSVANENSLTAIKQAAIAAVLARLINAPEHLEQYQKVLELIKAL